MLLTSRNTRSEFTAFAPELIIFDKGGTLIDFRSTWSAWAIELARRLEAATGLSLTDRLYVALGFDPNTQWIDPMGQLALGTMANLRELTLDLLHEAGLSRQASEKVMAENWFAPDPVADIRPLTDIPALFETLREQGLRVAIATMDDRAPTEATLAELGAASLVDALVCADDGLPPKPAPHMVWTVCRATGVDPNQTVVVGDAVTDMQMGRAAGTGLVIGVLSGVTPEDMLATQADIVLRSVAELI